MTKNVTVKIVLNSRRVKKNGTHPLVLRLFKDNTNISISIGYSIHKEDWNPNKEEVRKSCDAFKSSVRFNNFLRSEKAKIYDFLTRLEEQGKLKDMKLKDLKNKYLNQTEEVSFFAYTQSIIDTLEKSGKIGNANAYKNILGVFKRYRTKGGEIQDLALKELNYSFLMDFESNYLGLGNSVNGLSFVMRTLRAVCNRAIKEEHMKDEWYPFRKYQIKNEKTAKRAIPFADVKKIGSFDEIDDERYEDAKNYFFVSFCLMGISFIDMARIKVGDIRNGRLHYKRAKTGRNYSIKITERLDKIITKYSAGKKSNEYLFPIIKREEDSKLAYLDVRNALKLYNKRLKELAAAVGIQETITSYTTRHSWATTAKKMGYSMEIIQEALGHEDMKTTMTYLDSFDNETLDNANEMITG